MNTLKPIIDKPKYSDLIARKVEFELYVNIFRPLFDTLGLKLGVKVKENAQYGFLEALQRGIISYSDGVFHGHFTSTISKQIKALGGKFSSKSKTWKVDVHSLPMEIKQAIQRAGEENRGKVEVALNQLATLQKDGLPKFDLEEYADEILVDLTAQYAKTTADKLSIPMAMTPFIAEELRTEYLENLDIYIKDWADESIVRLRKQIQANSEQGFRASKMQEALQAEYGVSQRKAKFIARQETSLMVSKYREANYKEAGVPAYMWSTSHDGRVRSDHRDLNGKIFTWDSPPVVDKDRGTRAHPGEDFGCRCVAVPVLSSQLERVT